MAELKIKLNTRIMKKAVAHLLSKTLSRKLGCYVDIQINEVEIKTEDGMVKLHANVDAEVNKADVANIIKTIGGE